MSEEIEGDSVDTSFELMVADLDTKTDELNEDGAAFFRSNVYDEARPVAVIQPACMS